ncbi:MAG: thioesterase family protein [Myxococcota bacterium]|nr:thioesterase family protein [Myxococcota bacterium]
MGSEPFRYRVRVQYVDTDQGGVVHHAAYLRFLEQARVELLRQRGVDYRRFEREVGKGLPVAEVRIRYERPARFDDELEVEAWVGVINRAKIRFDYRIWRGDERLTSAEITCACVDLAKERICSMDPSLREAFE